MNQSTKSYRPYFIALIPLAVVVAALSILEITGITHFFHKVPAPRTASSYTKGEPVPKPSSGTSSNTTGPSTSGQQPGDEKSDSSSPTSDSPIMPSGNFVSNHHPNLGGSPAPNTLSSVCATSPGARCAITFTHDGITKSLPTQVVDRGGSAYWSWKLQDVGLTVGSWHIQAIATLSTQTVTADDALTLEVAQ